jgi:hypothetical protein
MAKGKKTGGRQKGSQNKATQKRKELAEQLMDAGQTPLEYMLRVMRDEAADEKRRDSMAQAAAPYIHPKLAAVEHSGDLTVYHEDALGDLE